MTAHVDPAGSFGVERPSRLECLIAHDRPDVVQEASVQLRRRGISVFWTAHTGSEVVETIGAHQPSLALLELGGDDGLDVATVRAAAEVSPSTRTVLYLRAGGSLVLEALEAGAKGILRRNAPAADLGRAIDTVLGGGVSADAGLARSLTSAEAPRPVVMLTEREQEVLGCSRTASRTRRSENGSC